MSSTPFWINDLDIFFNTSEFAQVARIGPSGSQSEIKVIFDQTPNSLNEMDHVDLQSAIPMITAKTSDVAAYRSDTQVEVNNKTYKIRNIKDEGSGISRVLLYEA